MMPYKKYDKNVLIVDDEKSLLEILVEELESYFTNVFPAINPYDAEKILVKEKIDIVITDMHMPRKNGLVFFQDFQKNNPFSETPWIFMSADYSPQIIEEVCKLGIVDFIQKPFEIQQIIKLVDDIDYRKKWPLESIIQIIQSVSGVELSVEKKLLVELKIMRRARSLGIKSHNEYATFFQKNKEIEILEIVPLATTQTLAASAIRKSLNNQKKIHPFTEGEKKIKKVFIIDASEDIRSMLKKILSPEYGFMVIDEATNPIEAEEKLKSLKPDIITLDIHMPLMDGITYLELIKDKNYPPIVVISSIKHNDIIKYFNFDEELDYIEKPQNLNLIDDSDKIREVVKFASLKKDKNYFKNKKSKNSKLFENKIHPMSFIVMGSSTGGVEALTKILTQFPSTTPPVFIIQQMPQNSTATFAKHLSTLCKIVITEAIDGEMIQANHVYIAPSDKQMKIVPVDDNLMINITEDPPVNGHRPSIDYLFQSVSIIAQKKKFRISAAILTGMGNDGSMGIKALFDEGCHTIAQDEKTCTVFDMPKAAIKLGGIKEILPLESIPYHLFKSLIL